MAKRRTRTKKPRGPRAHAEAASTRSALVPWRRRLGSVLDSLITWGRENYGPALDAHLVRLFGDPPRPARPEDLDRATEDLFCSPGSADGTASVLRAFAEQAPDLEADERSQLLRWESERRRGVFVVQGSHRERLVLWDPLEGAVLTLQLLAKRSAEAAGAIRPGTVVTATFQPWMARLVAVGSLEFFSDPRALGLFREQTVASGAAWHEPPAAAPQTSRPEGLT